MGHVTSGVSDVGFRWEPDEVARILELASPHEAAGGSAARLVYEVIPRHQIQGNDQRNSMCSK